ncbi:lyase family protein [Kineococcus rhizosphaerae]|uniref:3-carboxy-cis,cis-muconate cycloisomerase n=1 Tax=Kineococcus rhizosphaerae TaxID=559628 RepID=A0A2T0R3L3_9ACTN|nr:lyase family protein [Kineococcus rhizosphaerae]PRY14636.1 3-carboxy-cis,cis-muconate cycloisomerase [Kineococcus rhizosphaerae]
MSDLFRPGDHRAGELFTDAAFTAAMVAVESAWAGVDLHVPDLDLASATESGANPVIPLVRALKEANPGVDVHTGLTSQDVLDTALVLLLREAVTVVRENLDRAGAALGSLDDAHGRTPAIARTLTQWALPITLSERFTAWGTGLAEAAHDLAALVFPVQAGGPVGTLADRRGLAARLGLADVASWHTNRRPVTRAGDALVAACDACGHVARDVLTLSRPELGEVSEGSGGGSSSMPHKANPALSTLVRSTALVAPHLGAALHSAAADQVDERADGAWHAEWDTLRLLARRTVVATAQTADLLAGLRVHPERIAANLAAAEQIRGGTA